MVTGDDVPDDDRLELSEHVHALILRSRDECVQMLRDRADRIAGMSATEFVAIEGLSVDWSSDELAGRLAKAGVSFIEYVFSKPGWRIRTPRYERYASSKEIEEVLDGAR